MTQKKFHVEAKAFVKKVISQRKRLIKKGVSHVPGAPRLVDKLERQLNYWPYSTNETMARFIYNYQQDISDLIPGGKNRAGVAFSQQLLELVNKSNNILHPHAAVC